MSDVQLLFAILGALYAWECIIWLRRGGVAFSTWTGRTWRRQHPATMLGNQRGGFVFAAPLPPLGNFLITHQPPFSLGPEGVLMFVSTNVNPGWRPIQSGRFLTWEEAGRLRLDGKKLLFQKEKIFAASTVTLANHLLTALTELARLAPEQRDAAIKKLLRGSLDQKRIETLRRDFDQQLRPIRILTNALFGLVFILAPLLIAFIGLKLVWLGVLLILLALTISIATLFNRLHRKFFPAAADDRFTQTLIMAFAPATAMRAHDIAARPLLENFHPLAVAKTVFSPEQFLPFARHFLRDLRNPAWPTCPNSHPAAIATELFFRRAYFETVEAWLAETKISPNELCLPPQPADESCRSYCPRCEAQFTTPAGECADCGGLPLAAFGKAS